MFSTYHTLYIYSEVRCTLFTSHLVLASAVHLGTKVSASPSAQIFWTFQCSGVFFTQISKLSSKPLGQDKMPTNKTSADFFNVNGFNGSHTWHVCDFYTSKYVHTYPCTHVQVNVFSQGKLKVNFVSMLSTFLAKKFIISIHSEMPLRLRRKM
jgi:hypothetical protein